MSQLDFMARLLDGAEVEWKKLGEVGQFAYGYAAKAQETGTALTP